MAKTSRSCPQKSIGVFSSVERTSVDIGALPLGKQGFNSPRLHLSDYQRFTDFFEVGKTNGKTISADFQDRP